MELIKANGIFVFSHIMFDGSINKFLQDRSISSKGAKCYIFHIGLNSLPSSNDGFCNTLVCKDRLAFEITNVGTLTGKIFNLGLFPVIFSFEYFLPPWAFVSLHLNFLSAPVSNVACFLHVLLDPEEALIIIFDTDRAIHPPCYLIPYLLENGIDYS